MRAGPTAARYGSSSVADGRRGHPPRTLVAPRMVPRRTDLAGVDDAEEAGTALFYTARVGRRLHCTLALPAAAVGGGGDTEKSRSPHERLARTPALQTSVNAVMAPLRLAVHVAAVAGQVVVAMANVDELRWPTAHRLGTRGTARQA